MRRFLLACAAATGLALAAAPGVASAHAVLDSSSPAASAVLSGSPREITLNFNENVESSLNEIRLFDSDRHEVTIGDTHRQEFDPSVVVAEVPRLDDGLYVVVWHAVSADGHPVNGAFPFEVGAASSGGADRLLQNVLSNVDNGSPLGNPLATVRFLAFVATMVLVGSVILSWGAAVPAWVSLGRLLRLATVALAVGSLGVLLLQGPYASGRGWGSVFDAGLIGDVMSTRIGIASLARLALAVVFGGLAVSLAHKDGTPWRNAALLSSLVLVATWSVSGHPSAERMSTLYVPVDMAHLVAVSAWVGGLVALWWVRNDSRDTALASRFSRIASVAMPVAVATGVLQGLHILGGTGSLTDSDYGRFLVAKAIIVVLVLVFAARARRRTANGDHTGLFVVVRAELIVMVLVIALTSLLVGTSPNAGTQSAPGFNATLVQSSVVADLAVNPAHTGTAQVHVTLTPPGGSLTPVSKVTVQLSLPSRDLPAIPVEMLALGPNHWSGVVQIPYAGRWTLESRVTTQDNKVLLYRTTLAVKG